MTSHTTNDGADAVEPDVPPQGLTIFPVTGIGEIAPGDDLAGKPVAACWCEFEIIGVELFAMASTPKSSPN